ncbi:tropomyosin-like [Tigriopus californicus]|uniref:tropomyosin-like n=1 Tax=Tigriopus californicus TaxID=6832 RepID=UPI0027DA6047|nr:tropomyosin-like [Tigriopus californicus]
MDAIKKKMQSLKSETENLMKGIAALEAETKASNDVANQCEVDIRDISKKISMYESDFDETNDKLVKTTVTLEENEIVLKSTEDDVNALSRRQALLEEEVKKADTTLADTVMKLAFASKEADGILKKVKYFETKTMRNEVEIEELDKTLRETKRMGSDSEQKLDEMTRRLGQKLDEMTRRLGVQEEECKRSIERAEASESKILQLEEELAAVGENMKQLEISAEKAQQREEKLKEQIHSLLAKLKVAEARYEYGEMNITKLNHRIDDIEDDIYREKLKIKKVSDELDETFDDMLTNY